MAPRVLFEFEDFSVAVDAVNAVGASSARHLLQLAGNLFPASELRPALHATQKETKPRVSLSVIQHSATALNSTARRHPAHEHSCCELLQRTDALNDSAAHCTTVYIE